MHENIKFDLFFFFLIGIHHFLCGIYTSIPTWIHSQNSLAAAEIWSYHEMPEMDFKHVVVFCHSKENTDPMKFFDI